MEAIDTLDERDGLTLKLYVDPEPSSPDDWDTLATMQHSAPFRFGEPMSEPERGWNVHARYLTLSGVAAAAIPIRIEEGHGWGVQFYESDDNPNGVMFTTHARVTELCGEGESYHARAWIEEALRGELAVWNQYGQNDVYGYVVEDERGAHVDSCWGFYGEDYAREEASDALTAAVEARKERQQEIARGWALAHGLTPA
jgi:hypothetical protein